MKSRPGTRLYRVDPRLVHATLMNAWVPAVGAEDIIIVDREVEADPRKRTILSMSADLVSLQFARDDNAGSVIARYPTKTPLIVLFPSLPAAERAIEAGLAIEELNIGHLPEGP